MIDVSEIDLDSLTELELWELSVRVDARLHEYSGERLACHRGCLGSFESYAARDRMKALI